MARKQTLQKKDFIEAGTKFLQTHPLPDLTMRVLGDLLGVDATACYRHFRSKGELLTAMVDSMLFAGIEAVPETMTDPRERVVQQATAVRRAMFRNPQLAAAFATGEGQMPNALELSRRGIADLRQIGLDGERLVVAYQAIESYSMGSTVFDLMAAPHNMEIRALRYRAIGDPIFDEVGRSAARVEELTDKAFDEGIRMLIDRMLLD